MGQRLDEAALDQLFRAARTHRAWLDRPVTDETLTELYELYKWGPTSANGSPARVVFLRSPAAKERLRPALSSGNVEKVMTAPVTAIVAYDLAFHENLSRLYPDRPRMRQLFEGSARLTEQTARRNSTLQGAYLILAARALGLDCGPMSGFDNARVDAEFFGTDAASPPAVFVPGRCRSNFLCNLGYGDPARLRPREPRLAFAEACAIL